MVEVSVISEPIFCPFAASLLPDAGRRYAIVLHQSGQVCRWSERRMQLEACMYDALARPLPNKLGTHTSFAKDGFLSGAACGLDS